MQRLPDTPAEEATSPSRAAAHGEQARLRRFTDKSISANPGALAH